MAAMLGVAGCGSTGTNNASTGGNNTNSSGGGTPKATTLEIIPNETGSFSNNFNPFSANSMAGTHGNVYETLFYFDNVTGKTFNLLGTSYKFSGGNKILTVQLRQNAKWTDGSPFTAQDVVFTFNDLKKYPDADTSGIWQHLSSVKAINTHEVQFTFKTVDVPFAQDYVLNGTYIVPQAQWSTLGDPAKAAITNKNAVGTGPYKLASFTTSNFTFVPNPNYYNGVAKVPKVSYPAVSSNATATLLMASGKVQWAGVNVGPNIQKVYVSKNPHNHYYFPSNEPVMLSANLTNPLLEQLPVRQAMSLAIDRNALSQKGESGYEAPAVPTALVLPGQSQFLDPNLPQKFTVNDQQAISILQKAGFKKDSNGIMAKNGQELKFTLIAPNGWTDWNEDQVLIAQQLAKIGIKVTPQEPDFSAWLNQVWPGGGKKPTYQLAMTYTDAAGAGPYITFHDMLDSNGAFNVSYYRNPQADQFLNEFSSTTSLAVQKQAMYGLEKIMVNDLPDIPLLDGALWYEYNDSDWTGFPTKSNLWINPAPYTSQAAAIVLDHLKPVQ